MAVRVIFEYATSTASSLEVRPCPAASRCAISALRRQELQRPVELAARLERADEPAVHREHAPAPGPGRCRAARSARSCRAAPGAATSSVISASSGLRCVGGERAVAHGLVQQDLDVHLVVGGVDAGAVVDRVGVDPPAGPGVLDPAQLGEAEVAALADHLGPQVRAVDPDRVVGLVADVGVRLGAAP